MGAGGDNMFRPLCFQKGKGEFPVSYSKFPLAV